MNDLSEHLFFIVYVGTMLFILIVIHLTARKQNIRNPEHLDNQVKVIMDGLDREITQERYQSVLDFMMQCGIINSVEYTNYLTEGLPFVKRNRH
jgi:hypothetical protein